MNKLFFLGLFASVVGCAAASSEPSSSSADAELQLGPSAEDVLGAVERQALFTATGAAAPARIELRFKDDTHLGDDMRHTYKLLERSEDQAGAAVVTEDKGVVKISWHATPSWQRPTGGYWTVDLQSNAASPSAPATHQLTFERTAADVFLSERELKVVGTHGPRVACGAELESHNVAACIELMPLHDGSTCAPSQIVHKGTRWADEFDLGGADEAQRGSSEACVEEFSETVTEDSCCAG